MEVPVDNLFVPIVENQLYKKVIVEGTGEFPANGQEVSALYKGTLTNGDVFDSNQDRDSPFKFTLGQGQVIKGWDQGFAAMRKGEKAVLQLGPEFGYGKSGSGKIPANATLVFEVELLDFQDKKKEKWELSDEEKLSEAKRLKGEANEAFKASNWKQAISLYEDSVSYSEDLVEEEATALTLTVRSNLALVYSKVKQYGKAIESANKVLEKDAQNIKALYRKGAAQFQNEDFAQAEVTFNQVIGIDANNNEAKAQLAKLRVAMQKAKAKEKNVYSKIFASNYYEDKKEEKVEKPAEEEEGEEEEGEDANEGDKSEEGADQSAGNNEQAPTSQ